MATTVQTVYDQVCAVMCEPNGFVLGLFTEAQFLHALAVKLLDFSQRAALDKLIYTQQIVADTSEYAVPDQVMSPDLCFVSGRLIEKSSEADLTRGRFEWRGKKGPPEQWHEDNLDVKKVQITPTPDFTGVAGSAYGDFLPANRGLTIVGPAAPSKTSWTLADTLDGIPDSFAHYLVYGILEEIFNAEGETRDAQRALYCHTRWLEGIQLANAIANQELLDEGGDE